jgi:hypothetical protein
MKKHTGQEIPDYCLSQFSNKSLEIHVSSVFPLKAVVTLEAELTSTNWLRFQLTDWCQQTAVGTLQWSWPEETSFIPLQIAVVSNSVNSDHAILRQ